MSIIFSEPIDNQSTELHIRQNGDYLHPSILLEQQLLTAISQGNETKAFTILSSVNKHYREVLADNPIRSYKNSLISSCTLFTRAIIKGGVQPRVAFRLYHACVLQIEGLTDITELKQLDHILLKQFINALQMKDESNYSKIVQQAITYVNEHLLEDLTLDIIAEHCNVSSSYLSHLFKKEVTISIIPFINKKRVEESKYFLLHTEQSISEIASLFQFCNQSYYTALFKKHVGITPKEYKNKHTKQ
ncbi:AraC family transcriptional regulator [Pontibacillus litoralis]|uniref:HTH araC/xylS-type domain-containing protein n=1 Tax=Pontibacillus litoralis JSM 072002 TaxID=1385512 RepID=A0A0A5HSD7_9BACI|nr:AraC family transcriptional regulator [Pontibacillus litoralis]KGX86502.1 hypothetical protein N784_04925 [Pontibacillus litoralis JSM 072002]